MDWVTRLDKAVVMNRRKDETRRKIGTKGTGIQRNSMLRYFSRKQLKIAVDDSLGWQDRILVQHYSQCI